MTEGGSEPIDGATFANLIEMTGGDLAFVDELVDTYVEEGRSLVERLRAAIADGSSEELLRAAHSLKSSSLNVGALTLGEQCRLVEAEARAGSAADQGRAVEAISAAFEEARAALLAQRESRTSP